MLNNGGNKDDAIFTGILISSGMFILTGWVVYHGAYN